MANWPADPIGDTDPLDDPIFVEGLGVVEKLGLVLEVFCGENLEAFARIVRLAEMFPSLSKSSLSTS
jgi:hypothetical protein